MKDDTSNAKNPQISTEQNELKALCAKELEECL